MSGVTFVAAVPVASAEHLGPEGVRPAYSPGWLRAVGLLRKHAGTLVTKPHVSSCLCAVSDTCHCAEMRDLSPTCPVGDEGTCLRCAGDRVSCAGKAQLRAWPSPCMLRAGDECAHTHRCIHRHTYKQACTTRPNTHRYTQTYEHTHTPSQAHTDTCTYIHTHTGAPKVHTENLGTQMCTCDTQRHVQAFICSPHRNILTDAPIDTPINTQTHNPHP